MAPIVLMLAFTVEPPAGQPAVQAPAASTTAAAHPPAPAPRPSVIRGVDWIRRPSGDDMQTRFPQAAIDQGVEGHVTIDCAVTDQGTLVACKVTAETPPDVGFGAASLALAPRFKMRPKTAEGEPVGGARVRIPLTWKFERPFGLTGGDDLGYEAWVRARMLSAWRSEPHPACKEPEVALWGYAPLPAGDRPVGIETAPLAQGVFFVERGRIWGCDPDPVRRLVVYRDRGGRLAAIALPRGASRAGIAASEAAKAAAVTKIGATADAKPCSAKAAARTLEIGETSLLDKPDAAGVWKERWPVRACGRDFRFDVTFTPNAAGAPPEVSLAVAAA